MFRKKGFRNFRENLNSEGEGAFVDANAGEGRHNQEVGTIWSWIQR
jgi:hypothetical protein